jgi:hypothetical protein
MAQRRTRKNFDKFPTPQIESGAVLEDIRNREYLSKFKEFHVRTVFYLALLGMTEEQMAVVFDISMGTFQAWKKKFPTFAEAIKKGKEQADADVVYSLYRAAVGFEHESEQIFCSKEKIYDTDDKGKVYLKKEVPKIIRVSITKKYPPDTKAAIKWLETRQPAQWSSRPNVNAQLSVTQNNYDIKGLTLEQLKVLQQIGIQNTTEDVFFTTTQRELQEVVVDVI